MTRLRARSQHARGTSDGEWRTDLLPGSPTLDTDQGTLRPRTESVTGETASEVPRQRRGPGAKASPDLALYCRIKTQAIGAWRRREPTEVLRLCAKADRIAPRLDLSRAGTHLRAVEECRRWAVAQLAH
ncbi:MAG TPA: hypothetical protein VFX70_21560 [Mycobacteriales bacterium]|nr:hypothetical protein [Mycobacteriales bacterium]